MLAGTSSSNISGDKTENTNGGNDIWIIKFNVPDRLIHGNIFADLNSSCTYDTGYDRGYQYRVIHDNYSGTNAGE